MPRQKSEAREHAREMWLASDGEKKLSDIASEIGVPANRVRKWKAEDDWEGKKKRSAPEKKKGSAPKRKRGAQPGNTNSKGKGNVPPAPPDNKRALKTGEFERILFSDLTPEEQEMIQQAEDDPAAFIKQEILLAAVREKRMMGRLTILSDLERTNRNGMIIVGSRVSGSSGATPFGGPPAINPKQVVQETQDALESIINVEEALTRVQNTRQNAIVAMHRMGIDVQKLDMAKRKDGFGSEDDREDDGFIAALNASGGKVLEYGMDEPQDSDP